MKSASCSHLGVSTAKTFTKREVAVGVFHSEGLSIRTQTDLVGEELTVGLTEHILRYQINVNVPCKDLVQIKGSRGPVGRDVPYIVAPPRKESGSN